MNEASNFCAWPCTDPTSYAQQNNLPPIPPAVRSPPRPLPGFPIDFQPRHDLHAKRSPRDTKGQKAGLSSRDLIAPQYQIANAAGSLSNKTIDTDLVHSGKGYTEYDTHNLYGTSKKASSYPSTWLVQLLTRNSDELCFSRGDASAPSTCPTIDYHSQYICRCRCPCRPLVSAIFQLQLFSFKV